MKSKIYSGDSMKIAAKNQIWIPAFLAVGLLMIFPVAELLMLGRWSGMDLTAFQAETLYEHLWQDNFMYTGMAAAAAGALLNAVNSFWYLYSSRKVDFYHSLPVKRQQIFGYRTLTGLVLYLVPYVIMEFLAVCIGAMNGFFSLHFMKLAAVMLLIHLLIYLLMYFSVVLVISMTGNIFMGILSLAGFALYGPVLAIMISCYEKGFFGTTLYGSHGLAGKLLDWGSPVSVSASLIGRHAAGENFPAVLIAAAAVLLIGIAAYFAYTGRPSENTGRALVYSWSEPIIKFLMVIPCGLGLGLIFYMTPGPSAQIGWWIFGLIVGTILAHGMMQVICEMNFHKFFAHRWQLLAAGAAVAVCALIFQQDLLGYDDYMPAYEKTEKLYIYLGQLYDYEGGTSVSKNADGTYAVSENIMLTQTSRRDVYDAGLSPEIYDTVKAIKDSQAERESGWERSISVGYQKKSGSIVYRNYEISRKQTEALLKACYGQKSVRDEKYSFLQVEDKYLQWLSGQFYDGTEHNLFQEDPGKRKELLNALRADVEEAAAEDFMELPCAALSFQYEDLPVKPTAENITQSTVSFINMVYVFPAFHRTIAILEETGYPMSMEKVNIEYAKITRVSETQEGYLEERSGVEYRDKAKLEKLKKAVLPAMLTPSWVETDDSLQIRVKAADAAEELYVNLMKDKAADFMEEFKEDKSDGQELMEEASDADQTSYAEEESGEEIQNVQAGAVG